MFKNLKDLINTRKKLEDAKTELKITQSASDAYHVLIQRRTEELTIKESQLAKIESIIANRRETLKGLNKKINPGLSTPKKAAPKKAVKKTK